MIYNNYYFDETKLSDDYEDKLRIFWDLLYKKIVPYDLLDQFEEPEEGNPITVEFRGRQVSFDLGMSIYEYYLLSKYLDFSKLNVIHEIGGGYGRTAYVISKLHPRVEYRIFDLEPSLSLAQRYLTEVLPDSIFQFNTPDKLEGRCDLLLAIDCLAEMTREQVSDYFNYAGTNASHFYFTGFEKTHTPLDELDWEFKDYPIGSAWKPEHVKTHRLRDGFFEALYKI